MRRLMTIALAVLLVVGVVGTALATTSFGELDLVRVVYKSGGTGSEAATNLGTVGSLLDGGYHLVGDGASAFDLSQFASGTEWSDLTAVYLSKNFSTTEAWLSSTSATPPGVNSRGFTNYSSGFNSMTSYYGSLAATGTTVVGISSDASSYWTKMNTGSGAPDNFAAYLLSTTGGVNLADLAQGGAGYVDMYLYHYVNNAYAGDSYVIRTMADGSTIINPAAVPIPGTVLLLGSGLLGLIGFRRKVEA